MQNGDHLLAVNEVRLWGMGAEQVAAILRQAGQESIRIVVARPVDPSVPNYMVSIKSIVVFFFCPCTRKRWKASPKLSSPSNMMLGLKRPYIFMTIRNFRCFSSYRMALAFPPSFSRHSGSSSNRQQRNGTENGSGFLSLFHLFEGKKGL